MSSRAMPSARAGAASQRSPQAVSGKTAIPIAWEPIETAPRNGTEIQARIPGNGEDNVIAWQTDAFLDSDEKPCGGWALTRDQEPPDCWTDGICWEVNEDEVASVQPTHWKPLPAQSETQE